MDQLAFQQQLRQGAFYRRDLRLKQPGCHLHQLFPRQVGMPLLPGPLQGIFQPGPEPVGGVRLHPAVAGDGVCGLKADPLHIVDEPIGVLLDLCQAELPINLI